MATDTTTTRAATKRPKLSAAQALAWAKAEVVLAQTRAALKAAEEKAKEMRARHEHRLEPSTDPADTGKNVKVGTAGGWQIRLTRFKGGDRFNLSSYLKDGGKITQAMEPHVTAGSEQVRVTVKRLQGPTKPGAVEPA